MKLKKPCINWKKKNFPSVLTMPEIKFLRTTISKYLLGGSVEYLGPENLDVSLTSLRILKSDTDDCNLSFVDRRRKINKWVKNFG